MEETRANQATSLLGVGGSVGGRISQLVRSCLPFGCVNTTPSIVSLTITVNKLICKKHLHFKGIIGVTNIYIYIVIE